ncbi:MAG TPA: PIN domain-containing protein [Planctomycetota bacterium]|jgi:predicted nucleic acid-binding protein|nr:PIN domain-containing protein [Planctomycetota bacterium]
MSGVLIETNVLIRAYQTDLQDPRTAKAKAAVEDLARRGDGYVALQNLDEFTAVLLERSLPAVGASRLRDALSEIEGVFGVLRPGARTLSSALHGVEKHRLSFWDSMIWAVARENGIDEVLTSDPPREEIEGVRYRNPFV